MKYFSSFSGDSSKVQHPLFQMEEGGAVPTSPLQCKVYPCRFKDIRHIFEKYHYKGGHMGGGISLCLALKYNERIVGGIVIGKLRQEKKYSKYGKVVELRRMACLDECPKNTESYFLSKAIWFLKKNTDVEMVISYSDKSVGHTGVIYRAANFKLIGETAPSKHVFWNGVRYHPRSLTIDRPYSYRMRDAIKTGEAVIKTGEPKLIFGYKLN